MMRIGDEVWIGGELLGVRMFDDVTKWKSVDEDTEKMHVPGGWLYRTRFSIGGHEMPFVSVALAFVPDMRELGSKKRQVMKQR